MTLGKLHDFGKETVLQYTEPDVHILREEKQSRSMSGFAQVLWLCACVKYGLECQSTLVCVHFAFTLSQHRHLFKSQNVNFFLIPTLI